MNKAALFWLLIITLLLESIVVCAVAPSELLLRVLRNDLASMRGVVSDTKLISATKWGIEARGAVFEQSGFRSLVYRTYIPRNLDDKDARKTVPGWNIFIWFRERFSVLMDFSVSVFFRIYMVGTAIMFWSPVLAAVVVDALMRREIALSEFAISSAVIYHRAKGAIGACLGVGVAICIAPVSIAAWIYCALLGVLTVALWATIRNVQDI